MEFVVYEGWRASNLYIMQMIGMSCLKKHYGNEKFEVSGFLCVSCPPPIFVFVFVFFFFLYKIEILL